MNLADARKKLPLLATLDDGQFVDAVHQLYYPTVDKAQLSAELGYKPIEAEKPQAGVIRTVGDMGIKAAQGVVDLGSSVVGAGSLITGGAVGKGMRELGYDPKQTNEMLGEYLSDSQKASDKKVSEADGFVDSIVESIKNPRSIAGGIAQSLPGMVGGMGAARAVGAKIAATAALGTTEGLAASQAAIAGGKTVAQGAAAALETAAGKTAAQAAIEASGSKLMAVGAGAEGAQSAGKIADDAQAAGRDYTDYALPALAAGAGTAAIGVGAGKLMGDAATDIATGASTAGVKGKLLARTGKAFVSEGVLEEMPQSAQEQYFTNIANGEQDAMKGVGNAAGVGLVTGGVMGAGMGALQRRHEPAVLPDSGVLSRAANAGQAAVADAANAEQARIDAVNAARLNTPLEYAKVAPQDQPGLALAGEEFRHPNSIDYTAPEAIQNTAGLENLQKYGSMGTSFALESLQETIVRLNASSPGKELTIIPHESGGYTVAPTKALTPFILESVAKLQAPIAVDVATDPAEPLINAVQLREMAVRRSMSAPTGIGELAGVEKLHEQERAEVAQAQAEQAQRDAIQQSIDTQTTDANTADYDQRRADANRAAIRDAVLADTTIPAEHKKPAFAAALKRAEYADPRLTPEDHAQIDDALMPVASTPNELTNAVPDKVATAPVSDGKPNTAVVDAAIAQGARLITTNGKVLRFPGSKKVFNLNEGQKAHYMRAIRAINAQSIGSDLDTEVGAGNVALGSDHQERIASGEVPAASSADIGEQDLLPGSTGTDAGNDQDAAPVTPLDVAAHEAATSPHNDLAQPTEGQKEAGNYKVGRVRLQGLDISIENPVGSTRSGVAKDGTPWSNVMRNHYGYLRGTVGADKDHIDTFIGENHASEKVFVVDQVDPDTGKFDESKVMLGFDSADQARAAYQANYATNWNGGRNVTEVSIGDFKEWLKSGNTKKSFAKIEDAPAAPVVPPGIQMLRKVKAEKEAAKAKAAEQIAEQVAEPVETKEVDTPAQSDKDKAAQDLNDALGDLGDIFGKNAKFNMMTPEQEQKLVPVMVRVFDAAFRLGYHSFMASAKFVLDTVRAKIGPDVADALTLDHLQGSYIAMAGKYKDQGATGKRDVIDVESKDDIESYVAVEKPAAPIAASDADPEDYKGHKIYMASMSNGFMVRDVKANGKDFGDYMAGPFKTKDEARANVDNIPVPASKTAPAAQEYIEEPSNEAKAAEPQLTKQQLNAMLTTDMTDAQLLQAVAVFAGTKREAGIAKAVKKRGLTAPVAAPLAGSKAVQDFVDSKRSDAPTPEEVRGEQVTPERRRGDRIADAGNEVTSETARRGTFTLANGNQARVTEQATRGVFTVLVGKTQDSMESYGRFQMDDQGAVSRVEGRANWAEDDVRDAAMQFAAQSRNNEANHEFKKGDRFIDGQGKTWEVWNARTSLVEAFPVVDGKIRVNNQDGVRFATDARARSANPEARTDFTPIAPEKKPVTPQVPMSAAQDAADNKKADARKFLIEQAEARVTDLRAKQKAAEDSGGGNAWAYDSKIANAEKALTEFRDKLGVQQEAADAVIPDREAIATRYAQLLAEGRDGVSPVPTDFHRRFADDIIAKSAYRLKWIANGMNDKSKKVFAEFTGIKLPKAQGASWEALKTWAGVTAEQDDAHNAAADARLNAKLAAEDEADAERHAVNQQFRTSATDDTIISGKESIDRRIADGFTSIENISKTPIPKYILANVEKGTYYPIDKIGRKYAEVALKRLGLSGITKDTDGDSLQSVEQAAAEKADNERELADMKAKGQTPISDEQAAHLFGKPQPAKESPVETPAAAAAPPEKALADIEVTVDEINSDTGNRSQVILRASDALTASDEKISSLKNLLNCLLG